MKKTLLLHSTNIDMLNCMHPCFFIYIVVYINIFNSVVDISNGYVLKNVLICRFLVYNYVRNL
jgi:hypothetical protein